MIATCYYSSMVAFGYHCGGMKMKISDTPVIASRAESSQVNVRMQKELKEALLQQAKENGRSTNTEILHRLRRTFLEEQSHV